MIERLPQAPAAHDPQNRNPAIHVEAERLVFVVPETDGGEPNAFAIQLGEILQNGDTHGALLWGMFFQLAEMVSLQRRLIDTANEQRAEAQVQLNALDPAKMIREILATAGMGPPSPEGNATRTCPGGTVTQKEA